MRGTGRYNLAQGAIATAQGIGASSSGLAAGVIVDHFGYSAGFLAAGAAASVALAVFALWMPETAKPETGVTTTGRKPPSYSKSRRDREAAPGDRPIHRARVVSGRPSHRCRSS
jgi:MFS family permease